MSCHSQPNSTILTFYCKGSLHTKAESVIVRWAHWKYVFKRQAYQYIFYRITKNLEANPGPIFIIQKRMSEKFLLLNSEKTEMLVIAPARQRHHVDQVTVTLDNCVISQSSTVKNLGVTFDSTLSFDQHIKEITKITFYHLCNIAKIRSFLSTTDAEILIHAFVLSRLDYCNALFSGSTWEH